MAQQIELGNWGRSWLRSSISDKDGTASSTRIMQCLVVSNALTIVFLLVLVAAHKTPINLNDVGAFMTPLTVFVVTLVSALGVIKTTGEVINNRAPNAPDNQGAPPTVISPLEPADVATPPST